MNSQIKDVSDTAFWIAHLRGLEDRRPDALFHDPFAMRLAGDRGQAIAKSMRLSSMVGWTVVLRTGIIDRYITCAARAGVDCILNLGAGLDARPYRLDLPTALRWVEADYPHMIEYKETRLREFAPRCMVDRVPLDLADRPARQKLFSQVNSQSTATLVLTEGVIPYLSNDEVASLVTDVNTMDRAGLWIVDYFSRQMLEYRRGRTPHSMKNAPFRFEPDDWFGFFRERGWQTRDVRYFSDEGRRVGRPPPLAVWMKILMALSRLAAPRRMRAAWDRFAGYALLERMNQQASSHLEVR